MTKNRYAAIDAAIDRFADALKRKARKKAKEKGDSWMRNDWHHACRVALLEHVNKGDPVDVGLYAVFAHHHGWMTTPPDPLHAAFSLPLCVRRRVVRKIKKQLAVLKASKKRP